MKNQGSKKATQPLMRTGQTLYLLLGLLCVALAALGVALPLLPTTPFLLLAAGCFARSSTRYYEWLLSHKVFGPLITNWETKRCIDATIKRIAVGSVLLFGTLSMLLITSNLARGIGAVLLLIGFTVVLRLPTCAGNTDTEKGIKHK